jgi:hypothetical protein
MKELTMPDFVEWTKHLFDRQDVAIALEQAYKQGYALGWFEGSYQEEDKNA